MQTEKSMPNSKKKKTENTMLEPPRVHINVHVTKQPKV